VQLVRIVLLSGAVIFPATPAIAADALKFGPVPQWVQPKALPDTKPTEAPVAILLTDQQVLLERGRTLTFAETVIRIENPQGLAAGNISLMWQPATDSVTVNKLQIRRGNQVIDVLKGGQTFTTVRRETNLEAATLDGTLTANIQPEGLQVGDIIDLAITTEESDPVFQGHIQGALAGWNATIARAHSSISWPASMDVNFRRSDLLPQAVKTSKGDRTVLELSADNIEPLIAPKAAPARFSIGRIAEISDFRSWDDVAKLMVPLFRGAAVIPAAGPLHEEVERIRSSTTDPKQRAEQALALVQDRVRYVALLMGQGGYVPATAEQTWSRRFGDCKAKTALLLAILHSLGIQAEPVLVNSSLGDAVAERLPMLVLFDHVLARAHIGGKDYWLDGTRTGDVSIDRIQVPDFGWGLPLLANASLIKIEPAPLDAPTSEKRIQVDATAGIFAPAAIDIEQVFRGDSATILNAFYSRLTADQRTQTLTETAHQNFDSMTVDSTAVNFDKLTGQIKVSIKGSAKLDWKNGWYFVPATTLAFDPDFDRPAGPLHDSPVATDYPSFEKRVVTLRLPPGFAKGQDFPGDVSEIEAGVEYRRKTSVQGDVVTIESTERSLVPEVSYKDALAAQARLKKLYDDDFYVGLNRDYRPTEKDVASKLAETPASQDDLLGRGMLLLDSGRTDEAIADLTSVLKADPKNGRAYANRGLAYVWKEDFEAADKDLKTAETIDPNNVVILRARALAAEKKNDCNAAIDLYTKSLEKDHDNNFALGHRAICKNALGKDDEALADSGQALKANPGWIDLRVMRANLLLGEGKIDGVSREAELVVQQNPESGYAFVAAGKIYARIDRRADAMKAFDRALAIKPEAYIYLNRAQSRPFSDYSGRLGDLNEALKLEPDNVDTLAEKAEQLAAGGDLKGALQLYDQVQKLAPDRDYLMLRRAIILYKTGSTAEAEKIFAERRSHAKTASDLNSLCWEKATAGILLESALQDCTESLKLKPDYGPTIDSLAFVKLRLGKIDESISLYDQAIGKKTGSASYMGRAIAYSRKGDKVHADADRAQALKLDGDAETRFAEYGVKIAVARPE